MLYDKITELCHTLGTQVPEPNEHGAYIFPFEGGLELTCSQHKGGIMLSAPVAPVPEDEQVSEDLCRKLLHTSLGIIQKSPDVLSLDAKSAQFVLYRRFIEDTHQVVRFADAVEEFLNTLELVREKARQKRTAASVPPMYGGASYRF